jgi:hypothetical protein
MKGAAENKLLKRGLTIPILYEKKTTKQMNIIIRMAFYSAELKPSLAGFIWNVSDKIDIYKQLRLRT